MQTRNFPACTGARWLIRPFFPCVAMVVACSILSAGEPQHPGGVADPDEGMQGSVRLHIPEPMVFDLVRPLGAAKGEFEVNSLFRYGLRRGEPLAWAPEIEYAIGRGLALEFELPIEGASVRDYKIAAQQKLWRTPIKRYTHGLQGIGEIGRGTSSWQASGLYIAGVRWHDHWSTISMAGLSRSSKAGAARTSPLLNHTVFYERWKRTVAGVEWNSKDLAGARQEWLIMPQMHIRLVEKVNLQVGIGVRRQSGHRTATIGWRLIREL